MSNKQSSNELARVEMLIIIQYLLTRTDKNNLSSQKKIQEFAKEKFDINIKRQRINECLVSLNFISENEPELLPFKIDAISTGERFKYYAVWKAINNEEVKAIIDAISTSNCLPFSEKEGLIYSLQELFVKETDKNEPLLEDKNKYTSYYLYRSLKRLKAIMESKKEFDFMINNLEDIKAVEKSIYSKKETYCGKIVKIKEYINKIYVVIKVLSPFNEYIALPLEDIKICEVHEEELYEGLCTDIPNGFIGFDDYLDNTILPTNEDSEIIRFIFPNKDSLFNKISLYYERFFGEELIEESEDESYYHCSVITTKEAFFDWIKVNSLEKVIYIVNEDVNKYVIEKYMEIIKHLNGGQINEY